MMTMRLRAARVIAMSVAAFVVGPTAAFAQATITGVVRDTSGGVLPGVTVSAASPALIEGSRSAVTDGMGQYRIVDLRPGTYVVTFTLTGFNTVRREGVELTGTFTATVNADLQVGSVEESVTVTGESPVVDVQSARSEARIGSELLASVPTGRQYFSLAALVPGMSTPTTDVGGSAGPAFVAFRTRGGSSDEGQFQVNGFPVGWQGFGISYYVADLGAAQEVLFNLSGGMGEARTGGPTLNVVGREGGNMFAGSLYFNGSTTGMISSNYTDELKATGLRAPNELKKVWDTNVYFGGPIKRDRLWFFASARDQGNRKTIAGMFANLNAGDPTMWTYQPDTSRQARDTGRWDNAAARLTWQASPRAKVGFFWDEQKICRECLGGEGDVLTSPEAFPTNEGFPQRHWQVLLTSPLTSRLLLEAGNSFNNVQFGGVNKEPVDTSNFIRVVEQGGAIPGITYRSLNWSRPFGYTVTTRASLSYITGSNAVKVGYETNYYYNRAMGMTNSQLLTYRFNNGVPNQLTMSATPGLIRQANSRDHSLYAQGQRTMGRLTLQGGIRYEHINSGWPEERVGPSNFMPVGVVFPAGSSPLNLHDLSPRFGGAYDLFGNGKTAVKATLGRYTSNPSGPNYYGNQFSPVARMVTTTTRAWTDANNNYIADCDLLNPAAQDLRASGGDLCGPWANPLFGSQTPQTNFSSKVLEGWNTRAFDWDLSTGFRHEILPRVGVEFDYVHRIFGNFQVTRNRAVTAADFSQYCISAPTDSRLGAVSGSQICDLWDVNPNKFAALNTDNLVTLSDDFGKQTRHYNGINLTVNARLQRLTIQGGFSTGSTTTDECDVTPKLGNPSQRFCHVSTGPLTNYSGLASYTIPRIDVQLSGTFQSTAAVDPRNSNTAVVAGTSLAANQIVSTTDVAKSLGRPLSGNSPNVTINLVTPGTLYGDRQTDLDLRFAKIIRFDRRKLNIGLDVYNVLNSAAIVSYQQTYGPAWLTPTSILQSRFAKVNAQFDF